MYCIKCGKQIEDNSKFCQFCGAQVPGSVPPVSQTPNNKFAPPPFVQAQNANVNVTPPPIPKPVVQPQTVNVAPPPMPVVKQEQTHQEYINNSGVTPYAYDQQSYSYNQQAYPEVYGQNYEQPLPMNWYKFVIWVQLFLSAGIYVITGFLYITGLLYGVDSYIYAWYPGLRILDILMGITNFMMAPVAIFVRQRLVHYKKHSPMLLLGYYCIQIPIVVLYAIIQAAILNNSISTASSIGTAIGTTIGTVLLVVFSYLYFDKRKHYFNQ